MHGENIMNTFETITEEKAIELLEAKKQESEELLKNKDKVEETLVKIEEKLRLIPATENNISIAPVFISLIRDYIKGSYNVIPLESIITILGSLLYLLSPIDFIPDAIPVLGLTDDVAVIAMCYKLVNSDIEKYEIWKREYEA